MVSSVKTDLPLNLTPFEDEWDGGHYAVMYLKAPHWGYGPDAQKKGPGGQTYQASELRVIVPKNAQDLKYTNTFSLENPFDPKTTPVPPDCVAAIVLFVKDKETPKPLELVFFNDGDSLTYTNDPFGLVCPGKIMNLMYQHEYAFSERPFVRRGDEYAQIFLPEDQQMDGARLSIYDATQTPRKRIDLSTLDLRQEPRPPHSSGFDEGPVGAS
jgi:hypothetical protein